MKKTIIPAGDIEGLKTVLNNYQHGTAGGYIENSLDKAQDTIEAIREFLNGSELEVYQNIYPPFTYTRIYKNK